MEWKGSNEIVCPYCGDIISDVQVLLDNNLLERLGFAAGFRRVGRFEDAQQELENLLLTYGDLPEALFGSVLNYYEVTDYAFNGDNSVKKCVCYSSDPRPIERNSDWLAVKGASCGARLARWSALSKIIEQRRLLNIRIKESIPLYRAILVYDYDNQKDAETAHGLYDILSSMTDIFFPPITLQNIPYKQREQYLVQTLKSPEVAPLMFVIYSDSFNGRLKNEYYRNVARQCIDFAGVHTKSELISVMCDYRPPSFMKRLSIKTIECEDFCKESYEAIANAMMDYILRGTYSDEEYERYLTGEPVLLNNEGLSPCIYPIN